MEGKIEQVDRSVIGEYKGLMPGQRCVIALDAANAQYFRPKTVSVACFLACGDKVSVPLQRLPIALRSVMIQGCPQLLHNDGLGVMGIPQKEPKDPLLDPDDDDSFIFEDLTPIKVDWAIFGWEHNEHHANLEFENICEKTVHVFVRCDGEALSAGVVASAAKMEWSK